jgi:uncharacterized protein YlxW (UPF0749 family)
MQELQTQIDELKREIQNLKSSSTIPRDTEKAFRVRIADIRNTIGTVAVTGIGASSSFNLPNTTGTLPIIVNGKTYSVLINSTLI